MWDLVFGLLFVGVAVWSHITREHWIDVNERWLEKYFPNKGGRSKKFVRFNTYFTSVLVFACGILFVLVGAIEVSR